MTILGGYCYSFFKLSPVEERKFVYTLLMALPQIDYASHTIINRYSALQVGQIFIGYIRCTADNFNVTSNFPYTQFDVTVTILPVQSEYEEYSYSVKIIQSNMTRVGTKLSSYKPNPTTVEQIWSKNLLMHGASCEFGYLLQVMV